MQELARYKYRLRFRKGGDLRLVSHHDLMHVFERMLRRAGLPIAQTQGFHPQPRMVFALSLALGIGGANEVIELDLTEVLEPAALQTRLTAQAPPGLAILSVRRIEGKSSSLVNRAFYRLPLGVPTSACPDGEAAAKFLVPPEELGLRCENLLHQTSLLVERSRPQPRQVDIRPFLDSLRVCDDHLEIIVRVTPTGSARPDEFARLLGLELLLDAGAYFERTDLEMLDEITATKPETNELSPSGATAI